ncbi:hypothetical protein FFT09_22675 [Saccharomonospora piscinae]|uniref:hypothetical protein n=1 Tax=Saccharomonospora piscinae TaxID=687388 RepID=UPI001106032C|nr:hypothetical protein [Saccharomonospora piscinae]TLW89235.1 hypothetical protein FFT09_22675 [Saccharomonospora piscinae]
MQHPLSTSSLRRAVVLAVAWVAGQAGHETADYLVQRDCDARAKQQHTPEGRRALANHALSYGLTQAATRALAYRVAGLRVPVRAQLAAAVVETAAHAVIDDGRALAAFADTTGKRGFHALAAHGVNGRALMDQAAHKGVQIPLGAAVTAALAD